MASSKLAAPERRVMPALTATDNGVMPMDAVYEVLLRLPAKDLCRFRAVCRPWRSLLSDPHFIAAHAAHYPAPLIVAGYHNAIRNHDILCEIMDLSGRVLKRVHSMWDDECLVFTQRDFISAVTVKGWSRSFILLNLADGTEYALPEALADEHTMQGLDIDHFRVGIVFGLVASAGVYKVLRVLDSCFYKAQLYEVFTLDGSNHSRWRGKEAHEDHLEMQSGGVVINGIVYFFSKEVLPYDLPDQDTAPKRIALFDLETEEWRMTLQGPEINRVGDLSMAALNGSLVVVHCHHSSMNLWFLIDFENSLRVKQHSIQVNLSVMRGEFHIHPLLVNDGRIVTYIGTRGRLRIYNPITSTYTDVAEVGYRIGVWLYTGNLLSLANDAN